MYGENVSLIHELTQAAQQWLYVRIENRPSTTILTDRSEIFSKIIFTSFNDSYLFFFFRNWPKFENAVKVRVQNLLQEPIGTKLYTK